MEQAQGKRRSGGCLVSAGVGCLVALVVLLAVAIGGYFLVKSTVHDWVEKYTDSQPAQLPAVAYRPEQIDAVRRRVAEFAHALDQRRPVPPLVLTADEINMLIADRLGRFVHVTIAGDRLGGQVSLPLGLFLEALRGRYLNGEAAFQVAVASGRLIVYLDRLTIGGKQLPSPIMQALKAKNLAEDSYKKPELSGFFEKIESLQVQGDRLIVLPRFTGNAA